MKLDYLEKKDVLFWLQDIKKHNNVTEYTLNKEQIEIIWQTVGGSTWEPPVSKKFHVHVPSA
jgi:hypothetical protein